MMSPSPKSTDMYQRIKAKHIHCTGEKMKQIDRTGGQKKASTTTVRLRIKQTVLSLAEQPQMLIPKNAA